MREEIKLDFLIYLIQLIDFIYFYVFRKITCDVFFFLGRGNLNPC